VWETGEKVEVTMTSEFRPQTDSHIDNRLSAYAIEIRATFNDSAIHITDSHDSRPDDYTIVIHRTQSQLEPRSSIPVVPAVV
jgi:hypothetical protein